MAHYVHDELNNRVEALSKEEIYDLLAEVIESGELPTDLQEAFITTVKSTVDGQAYKIGICTQAQYNELEAQGLLDPDTLYYIKDKDDEIDAALEALDDRTTANENDIAQLQSDVNDIEAGNIHRDAQINTLEQDTVSAQLVRGSFTYAVANYDTILDFMVAHPSARYYEKYTAAAYGTDVFIRQLVGGIDTTGSYPDPAFYYFTNTTSGVQKVGQNTVIYYEYFRGN